MISLDTETTGVDLRHGAKPFLVTTCDEEDVVEFWEADVDPLTREPQWQVQDLDEICEVISPFNNVDANAVVLQNPKFDVAGLATIRPVIGEDWLWNITRDTLLAGHLLASNQPHDLTTMALVYLGINIKPLEDAITLACAEARRIARSRYPEWRIAKKGLPEMPSAKESVAKFDMWLPRAIAREENYSEDHPWWTVCSAYANADSAVTLPLFKRQKELLEQRGLWEIYLERLKILPIVYKMESQGIVVSRERLNKLVTEFGEESKRAGNLCVNIAKSYGYDLELPKSGNNDSLLTFAFEKLGLPELKVSKKTGNASLDKNVLEYYEATLPPRSKALSFVRALRGKRKRDTALGYMDAYSRYGIEDGDLLRLFPSLNPTGTDTLRWSSSNPNEQNISKQEGFNLRYAFGPATGREWWSLDAKNIELRLPAYESGERELIELFERPDDPPYYGSIHLLNFHTVYPDLWGKELKEVGELKVGPHCKKKYAATWYQWCKNGGFAVQYGAVEKVNGTADRAFHRAGSHAKLKSRFSKLEKLNQKWIAFAERHGYVETMPDRTVNPNKGYPLLCTRTRWAGILPTVPLNYHVQSTAMWWMMKAMIRVQEYLDALNAKKGSRGYYMVMQVHDELVFDFPAGVGTEPWRTNRGIIDRIQKLMEKGGDDLGVPTPVGCEYHENNWSEGITV